MRRHFFAIQIALAILIGSSSINTTSAASIAASDPSAPMAIPISARESTGASLIPSPTNASASFPCFCSKRRSTCVTLSAGSSLLCTSLIPTSSATCCATRSSSPVSITRRFTPAALSFFMASAACGLMTSAIRICPAYTLSMARCTIVPTQLHVRYSMPSFFINLSLPAATW